VTASIPSLPAAATAVAAISIDGLPGLLQFGALGVVVLMVWLGHKNARANREAMERMFDKHLAAIERAYNAEEE